MKGNGITEAMFYDKPEDDTVRCNLCSHQCKIMLGKRGICGVRENRNGTLFTLVYGKLAATHIDLIEKKPLFHFLPGSTAYSVATEGCNFRCKNCQNWQISQAPKPDGPITGRTVSPSQTVHAAIRYGCKSIAYTYTEPTIFFEYAYETAKLAFKKGVKNVFVTNGYITREALKEISPFLNAANIDLKSFDDKFYRKICGARLQPVLDSIKLHKKMKIWIEITTLIIPTLNDSEDNLRKTAEFIAEVGPEIPWHVSGFSPAYQLIDLPPTPVETIRKAAEIGSKAGLRYVYQGNTPGEGENTYCYNCGELLLQRHGYSIVKSNIQNSRCPRCGIHIDGVGM